MAGKTLFILKGYPRLSETFIAQEILGLEQRGLDIEIVSLRPPREAQRHPVHDEISAPVRYLPERLRDAPLRVLRAFLSQAKRPSFRRALRAWLADFKRDPSLDRLRRFGQGVALAHEMPPDTTHIHAHFLHTPASVARYASLITGRPWSCSAHARDIWTISDWEKAQKLRHMAWLVTCTEAGRAHLAGLAPRPDTVELVYHGLDLNRFPPPPELRPERDGSAADQPVQLLSVGRPVEKKGFDLLLEALARLPADIHWHWTHIGEGSLRPALQRQADALGLSDRVTWLGARTQQDVIRHYRLADLFVLPCRIARDGDRDGLPNVLLEAQSQGLACLATHVSAIPEFIEDSVNGVLVPPENIDALVETLSALIADPGERLRLGKAGRAIVSEKFSHEAGLDRLAERFGLAGPAPAIAWADTKESA